MVDQAITGVFSTTQVGSPGARIRLPLTGNSATGNANSFFMQGVFAIAQVGSFGFEKGGSLPLVGNELSASLGDFDLSILTDGSITLRAIKGAPLTNDEIDTNFNTLNKNKLNRTLVANGILYTDSAGLVRVLPGGSDRDVLYWDGATKKPYWAPNPGEGSGIPISVEVNGVQQSASLQKLNFTGVGVSVDEPSPDQFTITIAGSGVAESESTYYPGYTFNYLNATQWYIEGVDASALFYVSRRCVFITGGVPYYGTIVAVNYDSTLPDSTTITMSMENGGSVPSAADVEVGLTTSASGWSPIASPPFNGNGTLTDIRSGRIGATNFWLCCAKNGLLAYSTNDGLSWVTVNTGTQSDLEVIIYDSFEERFLVAGQDNTILLSTTGTSWYAGTGPTGTTIGSWWNGYFNDVDGRIYIMGQYTSGSNNRILSTIDFASTWDGGPSVSFNSPENTNIAQRQPFDDFLVSTGLTIYVYTDYSDTGASSWTGSPSAALCIESFLESTNCWQLYGCANGEIEININSTSRNIHDNITVYPWYDATWSSDHQRFVFVGANGQIGFLDYAEFSVPNNNDRAVMVSNGFNPMADIVAVHYDTVSNFFLAVSSNGQICRSSNGIN